MAVILLGLGIFNWLSSKTNQSPVNIENDIEQTEVFRHPLNGEALEKPAQDFFAVSIMFDNSYDARPQYGLDKADIVYEALAEGNITRLMGVFDSRQSIDKVGPVRSARPYFMDWANEYNGIYMHVGGSPKALNSMDSYDFYEIDQIGAGEIYFWRDDNLDAPHNVFTSSSNWLRAGELNEIADINLEKNWKFFSPEPEKGVVLDFFVDYNGVYKVDWKFNDRLNAYLRWQGDDKFIYHTGEQVKADNIIIKVVDTKIVDDLGRREMDNQSYGKAFIFNHLGMTEAWWDSRDGKDSLYDFDLNTIELVPGKTWVQIIPDIDMLTMI
ncbi:MAG: DUF3048 domain-containing protein [Candidatus Komeilibacteria bacterium]|nr:DUF3048 domain-containing protein [Candidatus Komeilibacteria bacterium]MBT4447894.1 DUF3048 domain-containing protein [Candidatus Komeilibacteria bacterium]